MGSGDFLPEQLNFPSVWNPDWASYCNPPNLSSVIGKAVELVIIPTSERSVQFRFSQKGLKSLPEFTSENLKNKWLKDRYLAWSYF